MPVTEDSQKITLDYHEVIATILSSINASLPCTHDEFVGACFMNDVKPTWVNTRYVVGDDAHLPQGNDEDKREKRDRKAYHLTSSKNRYVDDAIIIIDYDAECHVTLVKPPRPILGYVTPSEYISVFPLFDGTVASAYFFDGRWCLASRNGAYINDARLFSESFGEIFHRLVDVDGLDKDNVYIVSLTSSGNCPYADTKEMGNILEVISCVSDVAEDKDVVIISLSSFPPSSSSSSDSIEGGLLGFVYRCADGIYIDRSDIYAEINKTVYDVPKQIIDRLRSNHPTTSVETVRKTYIITRAILCGWDNDFTIMYPSYMTEYISIRDYINALVRHIFTMCCTRTRNPDMLGSFVYLLAEKIGPLKTKSGRNVVIDTLFDKKYAECVANEYLSSLSLSTSRQRR